MRVALFLVIALSATPTCAQDQKLDLLGFSTGMSFGKTVKLSSERGWSCRSNSVSNPTPSGYRCRGKDIYLILEFAEDVLDQPLASISMYFAARLSELDSSRQISQTYAREVVEIKGDDQLVSRYRWDLTDRVTLTLRPPRTMNEEFSLTLLDKSLVLKIKEPIGVIEE